MYYEPPSEYHKHETLLRRSNNTILKHYNTKKVEEGILLQTNAVRARNKLSHLQLEPFLSRIARTHSFHMLDKNYYGHVNTLGEGPQDRCNRFGFNHVVAENIAEINNTDIDGIYLGQEFVRLWMLSPGHKQNILEPTHIGLGIGVRCNLYGTIVATQMFY